MNVIVTSLYWWGSPTQTPYSSLQVAKTTCFWGRSIIEVVNSIFRNRQMQPPKESSSSTKCGAWLRIKPIFCCATCTLWQGLEAILPKPPSSCAVKLHVIQHNSKPAEQLVHLCFQTHFECKIQWNGFDGEREDLH